MPSTATLSMVPSSWSVASLRSSWESSTPAQRAAAMVGAAAAVLGGVFLWRRAAAHRARTRSLLPEHTSYTQIRVPQVLSGSPADLYREYVAASKLARASVPPGQAWFVYIGATTNETGKPWCGDCVRANPIVHAAFGDACKTRDLVMVSAFVERSSWKDSNNMHPFKTDSELHLTAIPTLFKFVHGSCVGRLVEGQCADEEAVRAFLAPR